MKKIEIEKAVNKGTLRTYDYKDLKHTTSNCKRRRKKFYKKYSHKLVRQYNKEFIKKEIYVYE